MSTRRATGSASSETSSTDVTTTDEDEPTLTKTVSTVRRQSLVRAPGGAGGGRRPSRPVVVQRMRPPSPSSDSGSEAGSSSASEASAAQQAAALGTTPIVETSASRSDPIVAPAAVPDTPASANIGSGFSTSSEASSAEPASTSLAHPSEMEPSSSARMRGGSASSSAASFAPAEEPAPTPSVSSPHGAPNEGRPMAGEGPASTLSSPRSVAAIEQSKHEDSMSPLSSAASDAGKEEGPSGSTGKTPEETQALPPAAAAVVASSEGYNSGFESDSVATGSCTSSRSSKAAPAAPPKESEMPTTPVAEPVHVPDTTTTAPTPSKSSASAASSSAATSRSGSARSTTSRTGAHHGEVESVTVTTPPAAVDAAPTEAAATTAPEPLDSQPHIYSDDGFETAEESPAKGVDRTADAAPETPVAHGAEHRSPASSTREVPAVASDGGGWDGYSSSHSTHRSRSSQSSRSSVRSGRSRDRLASPTTTDYTTSAGQSPQRITVTSTAHAVDTLLDLSIVTSSDEGLGAGRANQAPAAGDPVIERQGGNNSPMRRTPSYMAPRQTNPSPGNASRGERQPPKPKGVPVGDYLRGLWRHVPGIYGNNLPPLPRAATPVVVRPSTNASTRRSSTSMAKGPNATANDANRVTPAPFFTSYKKAFHEMTEEEKDAALVDITQQRSGLPKFRTKRPPTRAQDVPPFVTKIGNFTSTSVEVFVKGERKGQNIRVMLSGDDGDTFAAVGETTVGVLGIQGLAPGRAYQVFAMFPGRQPQHRQVFRFRTRPDQSTYRDMAGVLKKVMTGPPEKKKRLVKKARATGRQGGTPKNGGGERQATVVEPDVPELNASVTSVITSSSTSSV